MFFRTWLYFFCSRVNPFRTAVPFWGKITYTGLSPTRNCDSKRAKAHPPAAAAAEGGLNQDLTTVAAIPDTNLNITLTLTLTQPTMTRGVPIRRSMCGRCSSRCSRYSSRGGRHSSVSRCAAPPLRRRCHGRRPQP